MADKTVTISKVWYDFLFDEHEFLERLRAAGVDNWDGYQYAFEDENE